MRLVKRMVTVEVQLRREELVVEEVPLDAPADGITSPDPSRSGARRLTKTVLSRFAGRPTPATISEEVVELELVKEQHEVAKRVVPRERVPLVRQLRARRRPVSSTGRLELVGVDDVRLDDRAS